jgi:hypothetical protein
MMFPSSRRAIGAFIGKIIAALGIVLLVGALLLGYVLRFLVKPELVLWNRANSCLGPSIHVTKVKNPWPDA